MAVCYRGINSSKKTTPWLFLAHFRTLLTMPMQSQSRYSGVMVAEMILARVTIFILNLRTILEVQVYFIFKSNPSPYPYPYQGADLPWECNGGGGGGGPPPQRYLASP